MKISNNILGSILISFILTLLIVLSLPFIIIGAPFTWYSNWNKDRSLKKYLNTLENKNFFCYNNRLDSKDFIEKEIIPKLKKEIELIYLDGLEVKSKYVQSQISFAFSKLKNYTRFPHLLKIRDGQMTDESVNNELFNTMRQNKPLDKLLKDIHDFFELSNDTRR